MVAQHAVDPSLPGFEDVLNRLVAAVIDAVPATPYEAEINRAMERVVINRVMSLAQSAPMTQVRALATQTLRRVQTRYAASAPGQAAAEQAHRQLVVDDIKRFFERSADTMRPADIPQPPPGAPTWGLRVGLPAGIGHVQDQMNATASAVGGGLQIVRSRRASARRTAVLLAVVFVGLGFVAAVPAQDEALTSRLQAALDEWRASTNTPGASLGVVLKDGEAIGLASGVADRGTGRALTPDDLLMTGSAGKTFFAAVALQLIEAGTLDLNAPISKYLGGKPWFSRLPNAKDLTVRMLMTHTSGLVRYEMNPKFTADLRANPDKAWTPEEEIAYLLDAHAAIRGRPGLGLLGHELHRARHDHGRPHRDEAVRRSPAALPEAASTHARHADDEPPGAWTGAGLRRTARSAGAAGRGDDERRVRDQPAVRMDGRRVRDERAGPGALGPRALHRAGRDCRKCAI